MIAATPQAITPPRVTPRQSCRNSHREKYSGLLWCSFAMLFLSLLDSPRLRAGLTRGCLLGFLLLPGGVLLHWCSSSLNFPAVARFLTGESALRAGLAVVGFPFRGLKSLFFL